MVRTWVGGLVAAAVLLAAGCGSGSGGAAAGGAAAGGAAAGGSSCRSRPDGAYVLADPTCTPGAANPAVDQGDIASTICARGWTARVRPPEAYTEALERRQLAAYGRTGPTSDFEEDHLIPLELGGAPADPRNLWPEPGPAPNAKDDVEGAARRAVCDGRMPLASAQAAIASDWVALGVRLGVIPSSG